MDLTVDEAIKELAAIRNCLDPRFAHWSSELRKSESLSMAIEKLQECDKDGVICK